MSLSGRTLAGRYRVEELLGEGSYGAVYAATQLDLGRPVALKALHTATALTSDGLARFEREARSAAALGHPNIAIVSDFQNNPNEPPFLVMERLHGQTLSQLLAREGRAAPARVAWIAHQTLAALDVAHKAGIVHRDVKAANVFLVQAPGVEDFVKLLDFGVAKLGPGEGQKLTASGAMLGSPAFMAPEQINGFQFDHRVDIYAVGAMMYRAATGRLPFDAPTIHALVSAITSTDPMPMSQIDPSVDPMFVDVVRRAMAKDPNARYASAAEMRAALEPLINNTRRPGPPMSAPPMTGPPQMPPPPMMPSGIQAYSAPPPQQIFVTQAPAPKKSNAAIIVLLLVVVLLLGLIAAGVGGFFFYMRSKDDSPKPIVSASTSPSATTVATVDPTSTASTPGAPGTTPPGVPGVKPTAKPDGGTIAIVDAGTPVVVGQKQMAGSVVVISGGQWGQYFDDRDKIFAPYIPALNVCYAKTEFTPPDHQFEVVNLFVQADGTPTNISSGGPAHPVLFPCVSAVFRGMKWPKKPAGAQVQVSLRSRTRDNQ